MYQYNWILKLQVKLRNRFISLRSSDLHVSTFIVCVIFKIRNNSHLLCPKSRFYILPRYRGKDEDNYIELEIKQVRNPRWLDIVRSTDISRTILRYRQPDRALIFKRWKSNDDDVYWYMAVSGLVFYKQAVLRNYQSHFRFGRNSGTNFFVFQASSVSLHSVQFFFENHLEVVHS